VAGRCWFYLVQDAVIAWALVVPLGEGLAFAGCADEW
jgi:hypothetical protein